MEANNKSEIEISTEITQEDGRLVSSIKEKLVSVYFPHCISRVPETFFKENEKKYFPTLVSIGPFHHGKHNLRGVDDKKWGYLSTLLSRKPTLETCKLEHKANQATNLDSCVKALRKLEHKARKCYGEEINMGSDEFVQMMLVDGCFIIELFLKFGFKGLRRRDDFFFTTYERSFLLRCDIMLLENQIPFFVLQQLFDLVPIPKQCTHSLPQLALHFFRKVIPGDVQVLQQKSGQEFIHLLDLIHQCYLPTYPELQSIGKHKNMHSATKLQKVAGINIKKATTNTNQSLLDINFVKGVIKIPPLKIDIYTEITFRNLVAMEQHYREGTKNVTSYAFLMNSLIRSKEDAGLLLQRRILADSLYKEGEILDLFKKIHVEVTVGEFYYRGLCDQVNGYRGRRQVWRQKIKHICGKCFPPCS